MDVLEVHDESDRLCKTGNIRNIIDDFICDELKGFNGLVEPKILKKLNIAGPNKFFYSHVNTFFVINRKL